MYAARKEIERWPVPGSRTLLVLLPDLAGRYDRREITEVQTLHLIERRLTHVVIGALDDFRVQDRSQVEDLVQGLKVRLATMNAVERFDPSRASPGTFMRGIARTLVREQFHRRRRPVAIAGDAIDRMSTGGSELDRAVKAEQRQELRGWLDRLSPGELRAVVREFGPIGDYAPPIGPRRRLRDPDALPRAIEVLRELSAQQIRQ